MSQIPRVLVALATAFLLATGQRTVLGDTTIVLASSYCEGMLRLGLARGILAARDSAVVTFSNGLVVPVMRLREAYNMMPPGLNAYGYILFGDGSHDSVGYRYSDSMRIDPRNPHPDGNADTVWDDARTFPVALYPLDTVDAQGFVPLAPLPGSRGHPCFTEIRNSFSCSIRGCCFWVRPDDYHALLYARCKTGRAMKFQVAGFVEDVETGTCTCCDTRVGSVLLNWAADSAGNGLFKHTTPVGPMHRFGQRVQGSMLGMRACYDLRGRRLAVRGPPLTQGISVRPLPTGGTTMQLHITRK